MGADEVAVRGAVRFADVDVDEVLALGEWSVPAERVAASAVVHPDGKRPSEDCRDRREGDEPWTGMVSGAKDLYSGCLVSGVAALEVS